MLTLLFNLSSDATDKGKHDEHHTQNIRAPHYAGFGPAALVAVVGLFASSRPAHTAGGPIPVNIANTPLATTAADSPAKQSVHVQEILSQSGTFSIFYTVPAGKRLVIEYINLFSNVPSDPDLYTLALQTGGMITVFSLVPNGSPYVGASQKVVLYAEDSSPVTGFFQYNGSNSAPQIYVTLSGYLVDVP